jgi:hypothetical protein
LVEAATALAGLNSMEETIVDKEMSDSGSSLGVVSDEDERRPTANTFGDLSTFSKRQIFPQRLFAILDDPSLSDIVTWLPHGRSFVIVRPDVFTEKVLPVYLPPIDSRGSTKYASFTRKLNRWYVIKYS